MNRWKTPSDRKQIEWIDSLLSCFIINEEILWYIIQKYKLFRKLRFFRNNSFFEASSFRSCRPEMNLTEQRAAFFLSQIWSIFHTLPAQQYFYYAAVLRNSTKFLSETICYRDISIFIGLRFILIENRELKPYWTLVTGLIKFFVG